MAQGVDNNAAAVGRFGESKQADASATEVLLGVYGALVREAAEQTYDLLSDVRGDGETITWSIEGLDSFSLADPVLLAEASAAATSQVKSSTLSRELAYRLADALLPGMEQGTRDAIRREIDESAEAEAKAAEEAAIAAAKAPPPALDANGQPAGPTYTPPPALGAAGPQAGKQQPPPKPNAKPPAKPAQRS